MKERLNDRTQEQPYDLFPQDYEPHIGGSGQRLSTSAPYYEQPRRGGKSGEGFRAEPGEREDNAAVIRAHRPIQRVNIRGGDIRASHGNQRAGHQLISVRDDIHIAAVGEHRHTVTHRLQEARHKLL